MDDAYKIAYQTLYTIYNKHRRKYRNNPDTKQMCCMWSTNNPPDVLEFTQQISDIEKAFGLKINEDEALEIYDMTLSKATERILNLKPDLTNL
jgi:hypothetical protein